MAQKSLYDVLLVDQNASLDEIKLAFKRRALQVHPDKGGSKEEFHLVYQALETLGDPAARQKYDHSLAASKTGPAPHEPYRKEKKRKREEKPAHPSTSCKAERKTKPQKTPAKKSTTFAGKAPSKPPRATATSAEPQTKQTKLLMKICDLLKQLPREARNDVITNQFSQKQRVILERFMVDNADTSSGTKRHSEAEALAPDAASKRNATNQAGFEIEAVSKATSQSTADSSHGSDLLALAATNCSVAMAKSTEKKRKSKKRVRSSLGAICNDPHGVAASGTTQASNAQVLASEAAETSARPHPKDAVPNAKKPARVKVQYRKKRLDRKTQSRTGCIVRPNKDYPVYRAAICFDSLEMRTGTRDLKTALDYLLILTAVKQKMRNQKGTGTFVERLQAALASCAAEHGRNFADLEVAFMVAQHAACFIGSSLKSPFVRSLESFGKMRSVLAPFRQYAKHMGPYTVYWRYSPVHLEDAWERFQLAVAEVWKVAGVDSKAILRKIRSLYEAQAPFRSASLQRWERQHMATQDKKGNRPGQWAGWERRRMAMEDKNKHRPRKLQRRGNTGRLQRWERQQMAMCDKNKHRPKNLRERNPATTLECWERRQMAMCDKNKHRPRRLRERNPAARLECWERRRMAMQDKNEHRPQNLRQKLQLRKFPSVSRVTRQLTALRKLIARWGQMLKRESTLLDQQRQRVLRQQQAQHKKDQEERRRVEVLKQKRQREEERLRREWIRKRMRSDLTMDDILGQKDVRNL